MPSRKTNAEGFHALPAKKGGVVLKVVVMKLPRFLAGITKKIFRIKEKEY